MCVTTHTCMWHDSWLIHVYDMTYTYIWHDSYIYGTWLIHIYHMILTYTWRDSYLSHRPTVYPLIAAIHVPWHIHIRDMTHTSMWNDSYTYVTGLIPFPQTKGAAPYCRHTQRPTAHRACCFLQRRGTVTLGGHDTRRRCRWADRKRPESGGWNYNPLARRDHGRATLLRHRVPPSTNLYMCTRIYMCICICM